MKKILSVLLALVSISAGLRPIAANATNTEPMPQAKYIGIAQTNLFIRVERSTDASTVGHFTNGSKISIIDYDPEWLTVVSGTEKQWVSGFVLRKYVADIRQQEGTHLPYGTTPAKYIGTIGRATELFVEPDDKSDAFFHLTEGTRVAILEIENGWAKVIYWRLYGYFHMSSVVDLCPVYAADSAASGDFISGFMSFYNMSEEDINQNRISNIKLACDYISIMMPPGFEFSFDEIAGPYRGERGYLEGLSFYEGEVVPSTGGGVCQVSSTLYNVLLALPDGIRVTHRRAHGPSGVQYLPHGVDAAVGNISTGINLVFQNAFSFPIEIETRVQDGALFIAFRKV